MRVFYWTIHNFSVYSIEEIMKAFLACVFTFLFFQSHAQRVVDYTKYPASTYWLNMEYKIQPTTFKDKILVTFLWDPTHPIAAQYVARLEEYVVFHQQIQLVSILQGDSTNAISLSDLKVLANEYSLNHAVGIAGDLSGMLQTGEGLPKLIIYNRGEYHTSREIKSPAHFDDMMNELSRLEADKSKPALGYWQIKPEVPWSYYADPLIESPSAITVDYDHSYIYVAENPNYRIGVYTQGGDFVDYIGGGQRGDAFGNYRESRLGYISGMAFDNKTDQVFCVDLAAQKVKAIDVIGRKVYDFQTARKGGYLELPVDLVVVDTCVAVLDDALKSIRLFHTERFHLSRTVPIANAEIKQGESLVGIHFYDSHYYVVTTFGRVLIVDDTSTKEYYAPQSPKERVLRVQSFKRDLYALTDEGLVRLSGKKPKLISNGGKRPFKKAKGLATGFGKLVVGDTGNNRICLLSKSGKSKSISVKYDIEHVMTGDAMVFGEPVYFDVEIFGSGTNTVHLKFDLGGMKLYDEGRNEVLADETTGIVMTEEGVSNAGVDILIPVTDQPYAQMELYLTVYDPADPSIIYYKRTILNFEYEVIPGEATEHEYFYTPKIRF